MGVSLIPEETEIWGYRDEKVIPTLEQEGGQTYLQFTPTNSQAPFVVHGEIAFRYAFPAEMPPPPPPPGAQDLRMTAEARPKPADRTAHPRELGGMDEVRKKLGGPAYERAMTELRSQPPPPRPSLTTAVPHEPVRLTLSTAIGEYRQRPSPGLRGELTHDRTTSDDGKTIENTTARRALRAAGK
jgi:hypothetical protein